MELFPATDDSAWQLIRDVIDASDYYLLIVGGRYGSVDEEGLSYTEKEYDYALLTKKPVIAFFHQSPGELARDKTDTGEAAWKKLQEFRAKVEKRHTCVYWKSAEDLKARVIVSVTSAMKRHSAIGWVRADQVPTGSSLADILSLRNRVAELEAAATADALTPPPGTEQFEQGEDGFEVRIALRARDVDAYTSEPSSGSIVFSWNDIFAGVAPTMINEASDTDLRAAFNEFFEARTREEWKNLKAIKGRVLSSFTIPKEQMETCIIQFRALGLIRESVKTRSVKDTDTYWRLTSYGDHLMTKLRAIRRPLELPVLPPESVDPE